MEGQVTCIHCRQEINPLRIKALPNTKTCVNCSTAKPKRAITAQYGEKDNTWNDIVLIDDNYESNELYDPDTMFDEIEDEEE